MRKTKWVLLGATILVVLTATVAALRPDPPDDLTAFRPYISKDITEYISPNKLSPRYMKYRVLYLDRIDASHASALAKQIIIKRGWKFISPQSDWDMFYAYKQVGANTPSAELEVAGKELANGHSVVVWDYRQLSPWDVLMVWLKHLGRNPFKQMPV